MAHSFASTVFFPVVFIILCASPCDVTIKHALFPKGVNGGVTCVVCTALVAITEQLSIINNQTFEKSYDKLCNLLPIPYRNACVALGHYYIPQIIEIITDELTADVICHAIYLCYQEPGQPFCHAFPPKSRSFDFELEVAHARKKIALKVFDQAGTFPLFDGSSFDPCTLVGVKDLCDLFNKVFTNNLPLIDLDNDTYSASVKSWRGISWRGKDCNDVDHLKHPGAKPTDSDVVLDSNCNGIYGVDPSSGKPYEDMFCKDSGYLGLIVLGDSISAHFRIPPQWLTASLITREVFKHVAFIVGNEMDWPQLSLFTGYLNESRWPVEMGHADSVYRMLWERNRCNHRDYQNLAKNGADSFEMNSKLIKSMARNQKLDQPALVFYFLLGNDVCNHWPNFEHMTTPEEMHKNVLESLQTLDTLLPQGSHLILTGLVDGRVLYESLHHRIHPIGQLKGDVTYEQFYDFMNCLQVSPCYGWMNSNKSVRDTTAKRAAQLTEVLESVANTKKYRNFDLYFLDCPLKQVLQEWEAKGGKVYELIEPVDGFHPNLKAEALTAQAVWKSLESKIPHVLGNINPNNDKIKKIFGDQGGY